MSIRRKLCCCLLLLIPAACVSVPDEPLSEPDEILRGVEQPAPSAEVCQELGLGDSAAFAFSTSEVVEFSIANPAGAKRAWAVKPTKLISGRGQIDADASAGDYCLRWQRLGESEIDIRWGLEIRRAGSAEAE